ncbi:Neuronal acetylcholine receptor subunit alpha-7 [Zootermopsis nevadensis]|uniref:Neuronal acetylcholine receptor subunit alpha-7 n=1 Tax=Zootermopsis nevadensis TaxID=136037 RepID=A0A067RPF0_ZOONE|nr:Neuronal acetylcholine receptor subunit alpha-7 [Zootermopsis nevadensis]
MSRLKIVFSDGAPCKSLQGPHEKRLLHTLLDHYNVLERPVANESDPLQLSFGLTLMQIIDVEWNDVNLRWNSSEYGGVKDLRIPPHRIWKPDVLMYNRVGKRMEHRPVQWLWLGGCSDALLRRCHEMGFLGNAFFYIKRLKILS